MKATLAMLLAVLVPIGAYGAITINFGAADLRQAQADGGALMPVGGLVIIEASTLDSTFSAPTPSAFVSGDDIEIIRGTVNPAGQIALPAPNLTLSGNWTQGDPLLIRWFPSLTLGSTAPGDGTHYGEFRTDAVINSSDIAWITPPDPTTSVNLNFLTVSAGGVSPNSAGYADLTVVPEPSAYMAAFGGLCLFGAVIARRFKRLFSGAT